MAYRCQPKQQPQPQQLQRQPPMYSPTPPAVPSLVGIADDPATSDHSKADGGDGNVMHLVGPPMWETMHYAAFQCPEPFAEKAPALLGLVRSYAALLPCAECRGHFAALLAAHPPEDAARRGRQAFARWTVDAHNMVNARLGKPLVSFEEASWRYARGDLHCRDSGTDSARRDGPRTFKRALPAVVLAVALAALVIAGVWLYYKRARDAAGDRDVPVVQPDTPPPVRRPRSIKSLVAPNA